VRERERERERVREKEEEEEEEGFSEVYIEYLRKVASRFLVSF
jgi:hypothetical protein